MINLGKLYKQLKKKYGPPRGQWSIWCKRPKTEKEREEVIIEAILTQRANWNNVKLAFENLKREKMDCLRSIYQAGEKKLAPLIRPSGFYKTKANYLFHLAGFILKNYGGINKMKKEKLQDLREKLLKLKGIGLETADSILLYGLDKPIFVIDEYTRRLIKRHKLAKNLSYQFLQKLFEGEIKRDFRLYQDFHALIVIDGKAR